ncbi:MAG: peptidoglycan bridge formation glycyltransferase FemA/FemB family protein [Paludibacteraceae bacterium]|nr:peptidoglycan bridge formation glycyltransferase FemA/FemB family protein [Paludibacteraceae bacterium]
MPIKHLEHSEIDYEKWNKSILHAKNQLVYAETWYLDIVSPDWEALVADDYEYVMPLPVKTKYAIPYLVQPILTQQLGIFSASEISEIIIKEFLKKIPYPSYELNFNEENFIPEAEAFPNYILSLRPSYEQLRAKFSKNTRRNIEKAQQAGLQVRDFLSVNDFLNFYYSLEKKFIFPERSLLEMLIGKGKEKNAVDIFGIFSPHNELIATLCMIHSKKRFTYWIPVSNAVGKKTSAMFLLVDEIIRQNAESEAILDFEGSRIEGIARFYKGFGSEYKPYYVLKRFRPSFLVGKI